MRFYLYFISIVLFSFQGVSQLVTGGGMSPNALVQNVLIGPGVQVSNVFYSGSPGAIGTFNSANANVGIEQGIIMTTGTINPGPNGPYGPNNQPNSGMDNGVGGYPPLSALGGTTTFNAAILEFDFIPFSDTVRFEYVFGSEEYPEYVGSQFNDVFAFFITGPGINPAGQNMAIIPGTTLPVAINNVNAGLNNQYFNNNGNGNEPPFNGSPYYIQYDGFTTPLQAVSRVQCGETYHLIIAIADVGDAIFDSGIFLRANSFSSEQPVSINYTLSSDPYLDGQTMAAGCTSATFTITRSGAGLDQPLTIPINLSGSAVEGVDYSNIPNSITFAANQTSISFTIDALAGGTIVGVGNLILEFEILDPCGDQNFQTFELFIQEVQDVDVVFETADVVCPGDPIALIAQASGGGGGYTYLWSTGETTSTIFVNPTSTASYTVQVTDECLNQTAEFTGTVNVPVFEDLQINLTDDIVEQCPYVPFDLFVEVMGGAGSYVFEWTDEQGNVISNTNAVNVTPIATSTYTVTVTDLCGESVTDEVTITILSPPLILTISPPQEICPFDSVFIDVQATGGFGEYYYYWPHSGETTAGVWVDPLITSSYTVVVMDDCQTFQVQAETQVVVIKPDADFQVITRPQFINLPITFENLTQNGSTYQWTFGDGNLSTMVHPNNTYSEPGFYEVMLIAMDDKGCIDTVVKVIEIKDEFYLYVPNTFTPDGNRFNNTFKVSAIGVVEFDIKIFNRWGELLFSSNDVNFEWDGTYKGTLVQDGSYVWKIFYRSINDDEDMITGHINVFR
jgi:gliding motility-associated-like protein